MQRDEFTKKTVDILGKRVGFLCSNPGCRKPTIGANDIVYRTTVIGIGAHITAASPDGPRYDENLSQEQRKHIDNGIWLCSNCATLIDKDEKLYTVDLLNDWKLEAENESRLRLKDSYSRSSIDNPFLEADLIWRTGLRINTGYSNKNPNEIIDGFVTYNLTNRPIIHWRLIWKFSLVVFNNSNSPAFNISVESNGEENFTELDSLPKVNYLPPFGSLDLRASFEMHIESDHLEADQLLKSKMPVKFNRLGLKLAYLDSHRNKHYTMIRFDNSNIDNIKL